MKKIMYFIVLFLILAVKVNALEAKMTVSKDEVKVDEEFSVSVDIKDAAAWNIHVNPSGYVDECIINEADASTDAKDLSKTFTAKCIPTKEGIIELKLTGDITSDSEEKTKDISETLKVVVKSNNQNTTSKNPKTGYSLPILLIILLLFVSYLGYKITQKKIKIKNI